MKKSLVRRSLNRILAFVARVAPGGSTLRPFLHKLRGVHIEGRVFIGDDVYLENEYPERIELHEGAQVFVRSILLAHTRGLGRIVVGKNAMIGANSVVTATAGATLTIGEGAVVSASSVVHSSVPPHTLVGSPTAKPLAKVTIPFSLDTSYQEFLRGLRPLDKK
jgi:acetyltransferase-like isoleucine patch superfamily enzyme